MPLLPPGHTTAMPVDASEVPPPIGAPATAAAPPPPPPMPGSQAAPPPINPGIHAPEADDEAPVVQIVDDVPPAPVHHSPPPPAVTEAPPPPVAAAPPPPPAPAPQQTTAMATPPGTATGAGRIISDLAEAGFEGLDVGFGTFPIVRLQDQTFSTNEEEVLGHEFWCCIHGSRVKWLLKKEDNNTTSDFVYSHDQVTTTTGQSIEEVMAEWRAAGFDAPVWKKYLDITAQRYDANSRTLGQIVILSVPSNSVPRLTGYLTTLKVGHGLMPNQVITHVHLGPRVTQAVKPFYPWAFKMYAPVSQAVS